MEDDDGGRQETCLRLKDAREEKLIRLIALKVLHSSESYAMSSLMTVSAACRGHDITSSHFSHP